MAQVTDISDVVRRRVGSTQSILFVPYKSSTMEGHPYPDAGALIAIAEHQKLDEKIDFSTVAPEGDGWRLGVNDGSYKEPGEYHIKVSGVDNGGEKFVLPLSAGEVLLIIEA